MRKLWVVTALVAAMTIVNPQPLSGACSGAANSNEKAFASKLNKERAKKGLVKLKLDPQVSKAAKLHTKEMIAAKTLHHTPNDVLGKRVTNWTTLGENVGVGGDVNSLHGAFMKSPSHKENILFPDFRYVGIGAKRTSDGKLWVTFIFEAQADPGTTVKNC